MSSDALLIDEPFVAVYPSLIRALGSATHAIVVQQLWYARDRRTGVTTMTVDAVADLTGLSKRTVERSLKWLRDRGILDRARAGAFDHTSVWTVNRAALTTQIGGIDTANVADSDTATLADSDTANVADSSSTEEPRKKPEEERATSTRQTRLPASWQPTPEHRDRATKTGLDVDREAGKFRLHAEEKARTAANWNSAFTRWLINGAEYAGQRPAPPASFARKLVTERTEALDRVRAIAGAA